MTLRDQILEVVTRLDHVTFAELSRLKGWEKGKSAICLAPPYENLVLWSGMSAETAEAVSGLLAEGAIKVKATVLLTYMADGIIPDMPIARHKKQYKKPHWLPVVLRLGAPPK